jgi:hypothetical protein
MHARDCCPKTRVGLPVPAMVGLARAPAAAAVSADGAKTLSRPTAVIVQK